MLADAPVGRDDILIRNIAHAYHWFDQIRAGRSFDAIAKTDGISKRRIQQMIDLAFLAPDIVRDVSKASNRLDLHPTGARPIRFHPAGTNNAAWSRSSDRPYPHLAPRNGQAQISGLSSTAVQRSDGLRKRLRRASPRKGGTIRG